MVDTTDEAAPPARPGAAAPRRPGPTGCGSCCAASARPLITAGVVVLLFVVYEVYVTNYFADRAQAQVKTALKTRVARHDQGPAAAAARPVGADAAGRHGHRLPLHPAAGPRLRLRHRAGHVRRRPREGAGPLHRDGAARPDRQLRRRRAPGRQGRAVPEPRPAAGRRRGRSSRPSRTGSSTASRAQPGNIAAVDADGVPGREIVDPCDGDVLYPVPDHPGVTADRGADHADHLPPEVHRDPAHGRCTRMLAETVKAHGLGDAGRDHRALRRGEQLMYVWIWRHLPGNLALQARRGAGAVPRRHRAAVLRDLPVDRAAPADQPGHRRRVRNDARPGRRQLRQLRLQPRPVPRPARRRGRGAPQRRRRAGRAGRARRRRRAALPRAGHAAGRRACRWRS